MPTDGCSVCMPIIIIKLRGAGQNSVPYMMKVIPIHITVECGVLTLMYIDSLMVVTKSWSSPPFGGEVIRVDAMS